MTPDMGIRRRQRGFLNPGIGFWRHATGGGGDPVTAWFSGGGHGIWIDPRQGCWRDSAGTVQAAVGDPVRLVTRRAGTKDVAGASDASSPVLQFDSSLDRNYLDFTAANSQRLTVNSGTPADWVELSNGSQIMIVAKVSFGKSADPNALFTLASTGAISSSVVSTTAFWDDRSAASLNNALRLFIGGGGGAPPTFDAQAPDSLPPQQVATVSFGLGTIYVDGAIKDTSSPLKGPSSNAPQTVLTIGASAGSFFADMRLYGLIVLMGTGATAMRTACEAAV